MEKEYCLRWNHHQPTVLSVFSTLLENGKLVDITLAAEGKFLKAHRLVLSACSPYFENLLSEAYDKHPILFLKDVKFEELKAIMDFMYKGEVDIRQDQLEGFLVVAKALQIKGLNEPTTTTPHHSTNKKRSSDDGEDSVTLSPGSQKKQKTRPNDDACTPSSTQNIFSTTALSVNITMKPDKPNTREPERNILKQHGKEKYSQPQPTKDLMDMQKNDRGKPNTRNRTQSQGRSITSNQAKDGVFLTAQDMVDSHKDLQDIKIFIGKRAHTIKMSNHQYFL